MKEFKLGNSKVHYPVRGVIEEYPNYIENNGQQLTIPLICKILNTQEELLTETKDKYKELYDGDLNFITENEEKITDICYIIETLNNNEEKLRKKSTIKQIQIINVKEFGEDIAEELIFEWGDDLNIDHVYEDITYALHDRIKSDIVYYAFKYLEEKGYNL